MFGSNYSGSVYGNYSYGALPPNNVGYMGYPSPYNQPQYQNNNFQTATMPQNGLKLTISPVASIEEAKGLQTPMDGSVLYLVNGSKGEIYSKTLAPNGGVDFQVYEKQKEVSQMANTTNEEIQKLQKRVDELERIIQEQKQPVVATNKKSKGGQDE